MKFLPYFKLTYHSPLSENEIRNRLNCLTRAANAFRVKYYPHIKISEYHGEVRGNTFELMRAIIYRNSFLPQITGTISAEANGTKIDVKMSLHLIVMIVGAIFAGGVIFAIITSLTVGRLLNPEGLITPFGMLAGGYAFFSIPFWLEANKAKKDLGRLFECEAIVA